MEQIIAWTLVHSLWVALIAWALVKVVSSFFNSARSRRVVKIGGLVAMLVGTIIVLFNQIPSIPNTNGLWVLSIEPAFYEPSLDWLDQVNLWVSANSLVICYLWLSGAIVGAMRFFSNRSALTKYKSSAIACTDENILNSAKSLQNKLGFHRKVEILISSLVNSPMTVGVLKPVIYFPAGMVSGFSSDELDTILLHEMAHIKRNDYLLNMFLAVFETIFFFNPIVHLLIRDLRREMEFVCDDEVLRGHDQITYAKALVKLQEISISNQVALAARNNQSQFKNRIERMINSNNNPVNPKTGIVFTLLMLFLLSSAFITRSHPAEEPEPTVMEVQQDPKKDTIRVANKQELEKLLKEMDPSEVSKKVVMLKGESLQFIVGAHDSKRKSEEMMKEIREELIKDGILNANKEKITLMFQYSDVLNGKAALGDKYEKYKKILTRYFPVYDSFATTRVFRYQDKN